MKSNTNQSRGQPKLPNKNENNKRGPDNKENKYDLQGILKVSKLTDAETHIKNLLTNKLLYEQVPLDETIFKSDLVIKLNVPTIEYIKRNNKMQLGSIIRKLPKTLLRSYEASYDELYQDMINKHDNSQKEDNNEKQLLIRQFASFVPLDKYQLGRKNFHDENEEQDRDKPTVLHKQKKVIIDSDSEETINLNCRDELSGFLDAFTISYNTFIYSLQQFCGFKTRSFMVTCFNKQNQNEEIVQINKLTSQLQLNREKNKNVTRTIYIMLYLPDQAMIKTANKYHIKKQIDYKQVDPFLNDPMDDANRQIRYHSSVIAYIIMSKQQRQQNAVNENSLKVIAKLAGGQNEDFSKKIQLASKKMIENSISDQANVFRKKMDRKVGLRLPNNVKGTAIVNETEISKQQIQRYAKFKEQLQKQLKILIGDEQKQIQREKGIKNYCYFTDSQNQDALTPQQKSYLFQINRGKVNPGVEKKFVQIKKQRKYFEIVRALSDKYKYETFEVPSIYAQFRLVSKKNKFFNRLEKILLYKQQIVSPYGELALFNKMQRIKLSYLVLKESIRVQNLYMLDSQVFALTDEYQKFGKIGKKTSRRFHYQYINPEAERIRSIQGGLNGRNLKSDWHKILAWKTNFYTIRNYLGEAKGFQVFIKTRLIQLFLILTPLGVGGQILKAIVVDPNSQNAGYFPQFWFYIIYMALITIVYGFFTEKYRRAEQNYIQNFVQEMPNVEFMNEYRGPYMRDKSNDNANTYNETFVSLKDRIKTYLVFSLFFIIVFAEIGFYYGIRQAIVELSYKIAEFDSTRFKYLMPIHLLGYFIYFFTNSLLYKYVINSLAHWLTKFENRPTKYSYVHSQNLKLLIFIVGIEMIGPVDLVFIQYAAKTTCSSEWCPKEIKAYVYCRYIIMLFFSCISAIDMVRRYLRNKRIEFQQGKKQFVQLNYQRRLALFLEFVYKQSKKEPCADINLVDETLALIHFATFLSIFPFSSCISLLSMGIAYNVERLQILNSQQRPIAKSQTFDTYRKIVTAIGHWMLFFNFSHMFISLEWLEYLFPNLVLTVVSTPSPYSVMTLKYSIILLFMIVYEVLMKIAMVITSRYHSVMDKRKWNMYEKHQVKILNSGNTIVLKEPRPLHSISRTYNPSPDIKISRQAMYNDDEQINYEANTFDYLNKKEMRGSAKKQNDY